MVAQKTVTLLVRLSTHMRSSAFSVGFFSQKTITYFALFHFGNRGKRNRQLHRGPGLLGYRDRLRVNDFLWMIAAIDCAAFHHEADLFENADVGKRIAGNSNDICEIAGFESADLILPSEEFRAVEEAGLKGGKRGHSVFNHEVKFAGLRTVGKGTDVGANCHWDTGGELLAKFLGVEVLHAVFAFG